MGSSSAARANVPSTTLLATELCLAADCAQSADDRNECIAIVAGIYNLFDDVTAGSLPNLRSCFIAADTAAWVGNKHRCVEIVGEVLARY